jgi:hypothetical protein
MDAWRSSSTNSRKATPIITCSHRARRRPQPSLREDRPSAENISLLMLVPYSPEMDPAERWFQEFRRKLSNRTFESVALLQEALTRTLVPYRKNRALLKNGSPDTLGGWRRYKHCDINSPERYQGVFDDLAVSLCPLCTSAYQPGCSTCVVANSCSRGSLRRVSVGD